MTWPVDKLFFWTFPFNIKLVFNETRNKCMCSEVCNNDFSRFSNKKFVILVLSNKFNYILYKNTKKTCSTSMTNYASK